MPQNPPAAGTAEALAAPPKKTIAGKIFSALFALLLLFFFCAFTALGVWQVKRLAWKEDLIARVNARAHLLPVAAPPKAEWGNITAEQDEYRPVTAAGRLLNDKEILVSASVLLNVLDESGGAGYWVMTPLQTADGALIFINRGFVPADKKAQAARSQSLPQGEQQITGLLRLSEGGGVLFNKNDPQHNIWYNRQLPAMAAADGLPAQNVAPYFIDAGNAPNPGGWPRGGLTQVHFPNNHLVYAITWFSGALGIILAAFLTFRRKK